MNNKGFLLTWVLAIISIFVIVIGLSIKAYNGLRQRVVEKQYNNLINDILTKSLEYATKYEVENETYITVNDLLQEGIIKNTVVNPKNGQIMNCIMIKISKKDKYYAILDDHYLDKCNNDNN